MKLLVGYMNGGGFYMKLLALYKTPTVFPPKVCLFSLRLADILAISPPTHGMAAVSDQEALGSIEFFQTEKIAAFSCIDCGFYKHEPVLQRIRIGILADKPARFTFPYKCFSLHLPKYATWTKDSGFDFRQFDLKLGR